jgi:thiol-disulfide isomerase/thioredoxin
MRLTKRLAASALSLSLLLSAAPAAWSATEQPFTQSAFAASQKADKPILVHIWASWCPVCAAQAPTLSQIEADPAYKDLTIYTVDFDKQKDVVKSFGARMQSTLIVYHGTVEKGRSVGDSHADTIKALVARANQ